MIVRLESLITRPLMALQHLVVHIWHNKAVLIIWNVARFEVALLDAHVRVSRVFQEISQRCWIHDKRVVARFRRIIWHALRSKLLIYSILMNVLQLILCVSLLRNVSRRFEITLNEVSEYLDREVALL